MDLSRILAIAGLAGTTLAPLVLYELDLAKKRKEYPLSITKDYGRWTMYTGVLHNCSFLSSTNPVFLPFPADKSNFHTKTCL
jgi:hypothetical protein